MGRFSTSFSANFRKGFSKDALLGDALAVVAPLLYWGVPTLLNLEGYKGLAVGFGVPYLAGKALNVPEWCTASVAIAASHIIQNNQATVVKVLKKPLWRLKTAEDEAAEAAEASVAGLRGLAQQPGAYMDSFNGVPVVAYEGAPEQLSGVQRVSIADLAANGPDALIGNQSRSVFNSNQSRSNKSVFALN